MHGVDAADPVDSMDSQAPSRVHAVRSASTWSMVPAGGRAILAIAAAKTDREGKATMKSNPGNFHGAAVFLMLWIAATLLLDVVMGIPWFRIGDFDWRMAMAYHGILIPAWMLLVLAYARTTVGLSDRQGRWIGIGAIGAAAFTGVGTLLIRHEGLSVGAVLQILGMTGGDLTALAVLVLAFREHFRPQFPENRERLAWWTAAIAMIALSLATPLGHLAGAVRDLGNDFSVFCVHVSALGKPADVVLDGYIGSHSHQIVAAFLAAAFVLPLLRSSRGSGTLAGWCRRLGLVLVLGATLAQSLLYQTCAWLAWEPPDLFAKGPNGMPLDDFILALLGVGLLLLVPVLWGAADATSGNDASRPETPLGRLTAVLLLCFLVSVVALGVYIEFHEEFFGHAEGGAAGGANDEAYIRAHMLFGFMIVPILLGVLLHADRFLTGRHVPLFAVLVLAVAGLGTAGVFLWTFSLDALMLRIALAGAFLLLATAGLLSGLERSDSHPAREA